MNKFFSILPAIIIALLMSCSKDQGTKMITVPLESISATATNIDLSQREGWLISAGDAKYTFSLNSNAIQATPVTGPYIIEVEPNYINKPIGYWISFHSAGYYKQYTTSIRTLYAYSPIEPYPLPINIEDQSTKEKLLNADALTAFTETPPTKNLTGINFVHGSTLQDFEILGFPSGSMVTVRHAVESTPYRYKPNSYKIITTRYWPMIVIRSGSDKWEVPAPGLEGMFSNTIYKFKLVLDPVTNKISTQNVTETKWSDVADW